MSYEFQIERRAGYLHAVVRGVNSKENVLRYMEEILRECESSGCSRVLVEERLEGPRLGMMEVFDLATEASRHALGRLSAVAYVDVHAEGDTMAFAETVAVNRGVPIKIFETVEDARAWLSGAEGGDAPRPSAAE